MKKTIYIGILLYTLTSSATPGSMVMQGGDSTFDVFPIIPTIHYTYDYYFESSTIEVVTLVQLSVDSGLVEYIVHDSVFVDDTTSLWNVEERQAIWHKRYDKIFGQDTIYWTYDTLMLSLFEKTSGNHEITSSGIVWNFPLSAPQQSVYRYSDTTQLTVIRRADPNGADTLSFAKDAGLFHRSRLSWYGGITKFFTVSQVDLRGSPVLDVRENSIYPLNVKLNQNYPNPFNPSTIIRYEVPTRSVVSLKIFDLMGREVATLVSGEHQPGAYEATWNAGSAASGVYFYRLTTDKATMGKKMVLMR